MHREISSNAPGSALDARVLDRAHSALETWMDPIARTARPSLALARRQPAPRASFVTRTLSRIRTCVRRAFSRVIESRPVASLLDRIERLMRRRVALPAPSTTSALALGSMIALGGCGADVIAVDGVVRDGRTGQPIVGAEVRTAAGREVRTDDEGRFSVRVEEGARLTATADGRCDVSQHASRGSDLTLNLFNAFEVEREHTQVGYDSEVRLEVNVRCDDDRQVSWSQIGGPELGERLALEDEGRTAVVHTHPLEELVRLDSRLGVVAIDRHTRGEYRLELRVGDARREIRVVAAPLSSGLFQVPTGAELYLNGGDGAEHEWLLLDRPPESEAELVGADGRVPHFRPDRFGSYVIQHNPSLRQMSIQAGPYENVPRDCGRDGCHHDEDEGWQTTAHARTFRRGIEGELGEDFERRCWSCHATGVDFGIDNGGLHHTASRNGWVQPEPDPELWESVPRRVRRHGSVWCSACHGPGRIVPPTFRWQYGAKYQVDVCARCHDVEEDDTDSNHVSPHVDEWRLAPMSRFIRDLREDDPAVRVGCARCHSAQGFVEWRRRDRAVAPEAATVAPITCPTCHDSHDASRPHALRVYDVSDPIGGQAEEHLGAGAMCVSCHRSGIATEGASDAAPHAPQADLLVGRGARTVPTARESTPHRWIADTCVRCHMTRPDEDHPMFGTVGGHTFSVRQRSGGSALSPVACAPCHGESDPESIGSRDWDGDGTSGGYAEEFTRSLTAASASLGTAITAADVRDTCGSRAADVVEYDARLALQDASAQLLGDCDHDGRIGEGETLLTIDRLPSALRNRAYDVAMLRRDGSRGAHNPGYAFEVLRSLTR